MIERLIGVPLKIFRGTFLTGYSMTKLLNLAYLLDDDLRIYLGTLVRSLLGGKDDLIGLERPGGLIHNRCRSRKEQLLALWESG